MRFLLRLKHWQLFGITWGLPIVVSLVFISNPYKIAEFMPYIILLFTLGVLGWVWAIGSSLHDKLPEGVNLPVNVFRVYFLIPKIYLIGISLWLIYISYFNAPSLDYTMGVIIGVLLILHLVSMVCIILGIRYAAKTLRSIELGRLARFNDYVGEFFLIWFSIIGFWVLQPRINKLAEE
jgi:uncharacterized membrane protein